MSQRQREFDEALQVNFGSFVEKVFDTLNKGEKYVDGEYIQALCRALEKAARGQERRIIANLPPRYLKSIIASVALPAWILGRDPTKRIVCVSYAQDLADKFSNDCRLIMETDWYKRIFPNTRIDPRKNTEGQFRTTEGGYRFSASVGGQLTGWGGGYVIIDDPMKADAPASEAALKKVRDWYGRTLFSRLDDKERGVIILVMQRLHLEDLTGYVLKLSPWLHLRMPAIADEDVIYEIGPGEFYQRREGEALHPARESLNTLEMLRRTYDDATFMSQYQQQPVSPGGGLFKAHSLKTYKTPPSMREFGRIVLSVDTASQTGERNDYSAWTVWGVTGDLYYLLSAARERLEFPALVRRIRDEYDRWQVRTLLIEHSGHGGIQLAQTLRGEGLRRPILVRPEGPKEERASFASFPIDDGRVLFPEEAPWLGDLRAELLAFPQAPHDDFVDSLSQFLNWAERRFRRPTRQEHVEELRRPGQVGTWYSRNERYDAYGLFGRGIF